MSRIGKLKTKDNKEVISVLRIIYECNKSIFLIMLWRLFFAELRIDFCQDNNVYIFSYTLFHPCIYLYFKLIKKKKKRDKYEIILRNILLFILYLFFCFT